MDKAKRGLYTKLWKFVFTFISLQIKKFHLNIECIGHSGSKSGVSFFVYLF